MGEVVGGDKVMPEKYVQLISLREKQPMEVKLTKEEERDGELSQVRDMINYQTCSSEDSQKRLVEILNLMRERKGYARR